MPKRPRSPILALAGFLVLSCSGPEGTEFTFTGTVSGLRVPGNEIPGGWSGPSGIVVDDLSSVGALPAPQKAIGEQLAAQLTPLGVTACADFTYTKPGDPASIVTLRLFVFDGRDSCDAWWSKKYEDEKVRELYRPVDAPGHRAIDSTQMTKRVASLGNVWMTCHQLGSGDAHLEILDLYLRKIRNS